MRQPIRKDVQLTVFRRDGWICRWCGRPVVFAPAMKFLQHFVRESGINEPVAYYDTHWTRRNAPLLDHSGAVIDHVDAHSSGGTSEIDNLATACNKCNANKSNAPHGEFSRRSPRHQVRGKYGEPEAWDGLSTLFAILVARNPKTATASERAWLRAILGSGSGTQM